MKLRPQVTRKPAGGNAFALEPDGSIPAELLRPGRWYYATPVAPATPPSASDQALYDSRNRPFKNSWLNTALPDGSYSPLRWRHGVGGKVQLVGAIDGGALGTVCVTLTEEFWPDKDTVALVPSTDGSRVMAVSISAITGDVTVIGGTSAASTPSSGVTSGAYGDATHVGQFTVGADGRITVAANVAIAITEANLSLGDVTTDDASTSRHGFLKKLSNVAANFLDGTGVWRALVESDLSLSDVSTGNVSSSAHGFTPKSPADATKFLNGAATPAYAQVKDSDLSTSDVTTNNVSTSKHGFAPKLPNDATKYLDGTGAYSVPVGSGSSSSPLTTKGDLYTRSISADARQAVGADNTVLVADAAQTNGIKWVQVGEAMIALADVTTLDVSSSKHGLAPKSPADATKFLNGAATPAYAQVKDSDLSTSDITTNDVGTSKHGFAPKAPNDTTKFLRGDGTWATVAGSGSAVTQSYVGYNTVGGTTDAVAAGNYKQVWKQVTLASAGLLASIDAYIKGDGSHVMPLFCAIFDDNAGAIGKLIAVHTGETAGSSQVLSALVSTTARWMSVPISTWLPAATYWLCFLTGSGVTLHYDGSGSDFTSTQGVTWINTNSDGGGGTTPTNSSRKYSIRGSLIQ